MTAERLMNVIMIISVPLSVIKDIDDVIMIISVPPLSSLSLIIKMLLMNNSPSLRSQADDYSNLSGRKQVLHVVF